MCSYFYDISFLCIICFASIEATLQNGLHLDAFVKSLEISSNSIYIPIVLQLVGEIR